MIHRLAEGKSGPPVSVTLSNLTGFWLCHSMRGTSATGWIRSWSYPLEAWGLRGQPCSNSSLGRQDYLLFLT